MSELLPTIFGLVLASLHFSIPLVYYAYLRRYVNAPWAPLKLDKQYQPQISVIVPTYNESELIEGRLENLVAQDYPTSRLEILVIDSGSPDGTATIAEGWLKRNGNVNAKLIRETARGGKLRAVKRALGAVRSSSVAVVLTDADAYWEPTTLTEVISFFADPAIGAVTGSMFYVDDPGVFSEKTYRTYFNAVRVAESKIHSTPVHNGPLLAIRNDLIRKIGLPDFPGSDDSAFGSFVAFAGFRAIQADRAVVREYVRGSRLRRRVRRSTCVLLNFHNTRRYAKKKNVYVRSRFENIWWVEWWFHVINPWLLLASVLLLVGGMLQGSRVASGFLGVGTVLLLWAPYRTWMLQQLYLLLGALRTLWTHEVVWNR